MLNPGTIRRGIAPARGRVPALELFRERAVDAQMLGETTWNSAGQRGFDALPDWIQPVWSVPEAGSNAVNRADRCSQALKNDTRSIPRAAIEIAWRDQPIPQCQISQNRLMA